MCLLVDKIFALAVFQFLLVDKILSSPSSLLSEQELWPTRVDQNMLKLELIGLLGVGNKPSGSQAIAPSWVFGCPMSDTLDTSNYLVVVIIFKL